VWVANDSQTASAERLLVVAPFSSSFSAFAFDDWIEVSAMSMRWRMSVP
jgi:hypothetical protein